MALSLVAMLSFVFAVLASQPIAGAIAFLRYYFLRYYLGEAGVPERSPYPAAVVLLMSIAAILLTGPSVWRVIIAALLLFNLRASWTAGGWNAVGADGFASTAE